MLDGREVNLIKNFSDVPTLPPIGISISFKEFHCLRVARYGQAHELDDGDLSYDIYVLKEDSTTDRQVASQEELEFYKTDGWVIEQS